MAKKPSTAKATPKEAGTDDAIVAATLHEAAAIGWREVTLTGVAARAGMTLSALLHEAPTKAHLALRFLKDVDRATLDAGGDPDPSDSAKDRLFEIIMRRFDVLNRHKDGARAIARGVARDPATALMLACRVDKSAAMMLGAAGIDASGLCGLARIQGFKAIFLSAGRAWMKDDSADLAETMAAVDRALGQADRLMKFLPNLRRRREEPAAA